MTGPKIGRRGSMVQPSDNTPHAFLTVTQAAEILGVAPRTVVRWADAGELPPAMRTRGGHRRFHRSQVEDYLAFMKQQTADE